MLQRHTFGNQIFGRDQPPLGDVVVDADAHFLLELVTDAAVADIELVGNVVDGDMLGIMRFNIGRYLVQKHGCLRFHAVSGAVIVGTIQKRKYFQGIAQGASTYMYSDVLGNIGLASLGSVISMPVMFGGLIVAPILAKKFDLVAIIRTCILVGCVMLGGCFVYAVTAAALHPILYIAWSGIGTGLVTLSVQLQWGLVGESIDYNEYLTGKRSEGSIYGVFSLTRRIGQTLSGSLAVLMITWFGYQAGAAVQPASAILGIKLMVILIPAVIGMGSWAAFRFIWDINAEKRAAMAAWKAERAAKAAQE